MSRIVRHGRPGRLAGAAAGDDRGAALRRHGPAANDNREGRVAMQVLGQALLGGLAGAAAMLLLYGFLRLALWAHGPVTNWQAWS